MARDERLIRRTGLVDQPGCLLDGPDRLRQHRRHRLLVDLVPGAVVVRSGSVGDSPPGHRTLRVGFKGRFETAYRFLVVEAVGPEQATVEPAAVRPATKLRSAKCNTQGRSSSSSFTSCLNRHWIISGVEKIAHVHATQARCKVIVIVTRRSMTVHAHRDKGNTAHFTNRHTATDCRVSWSACITLLRCIVTRSIVTDTGQPSVSF